MKNRKGFTLVELLVTISILGVITGLSIPLIRNINQQRIKRVYNTYLDSLSYSSKLYVDSYSDDLFATPTKGCVYVTYQDLKEKNLAKDIDLDGVSCDTQYTAVKVVKYKEKYYYKPFIGCGSDKNSTVTAETFMPTKVSISETCDPEFSANITFQALHPSSSTANNLKSISPQVVMASDTGVKFSQPTPVISYGYSYENDGTNIIGAWTRLNFETMSVSKQEAMIAANQPTVFNATRKATTPAGKTGKLNLVIKVEKDTLFNLEDNPWRKKEDGDYVILGPFVVDNSAPLFDDSKIVSSTGSAYNSLKPQLDLKITDVGFTTKNDDFKYCYSYGETDTCPKPSNADELNASSSYKTLNPTAVLKDISSKYDGKKYPIHVTVADAAGNLAYQRFDYTVSDSYTLTFDTDGGNACTNNDKIGQIAGQKWEDHVVNDEGLNKHEFCNTTKTGYDLAGWFTGKNGTGTQVKADSLATANTTVYAYWKPKTYTVSYDGNGNTGGLTASTKCTYNEAITPATNGFTKTGYSFNGWTNKPDKCTGPVTLKATWTPNTYTVSYNGNGNTGGSTAATTCTYGSSFTPATNGFTKTGYSFNGWSGSTTCSGNMTMTATWKANTYTVSYAGNGNTGGSTAATTCTYGSSFTPATNGFTKTGYTFNGWSGSTTCSGNMTMTATWRPNTVTISYDGNGSTGGSTASFTCTYGEAITMKTNGFTRTGYDFNGWQSPPTTCPAANTAVKATWKGKTYTVSYAGNGNTGGSTAATTCTYGSAFTPATNGFTKTGHTFNGWSGSTTCSGNMTMTATWKANTYTISYNGNGATSGSTAASTCTYGTAISARANGFKKSHYHFNGWSGLGTCTGNKTLTATWAANVAIIRYHTGTSSGSKLKYKPSSDWAIKNSYQIWNGSTQDIHSVTYGGSKYDPINYHNSSYLYIMKTSSANGSAPDGKEWEKCDGSGCARSTYDQNVEYSSEQYCDTTNGNCYCCIKVNWK